MALAVASTTVAGARSKLFAILAQAFSPPTPEGFASLRSAQLNQEIRQALDVLPEPFPEKLRGAWSAVRGALRGRSAADYEAEYLRLFEVGIPAAPCPLYESAYGPPDRRREVMGELVRFYNHFGLSLGSKARELPDHLRVELEFLHYLTFLEAQGRQEARPVESLMLAQADFHERHLNRWTPHLWARLSRQGGASFDTWSAFARTFFSADRKSVGRPA